MKEMKTKIYKRSGGDDDWFRYITLIIETRRVLLRFSSDYLVQKQLTSNFIKKLYSIVEKEDDKVIQFQGGWCAIDDQDVTEAIVELNSPPEYSLLMEFDIK